MWAESELCVCGCVLTHPTLTPLFIESGRIWRAGDWCDRSLHTEVTPIRPFLSPYLFKLLLCCCYGCCPGIEEPSSPMCNFNSLENRNQESMLLIFMARPKSVVTAEAFHHQERCKALAQSSQLQASSSFPGLHLEREWS